ncbi:MAG TPA: DUF4491 family protein [Muribaculum sp.]|jgi:hypothetical protein|uniref:DUF4491 family protein n=1 Tax=Heminiphilus faecis TaxID=2601703 RepID=A0ABV4CVI6_9BACT|nr:DUF4491 family protein [Heminiphilus faecis]RLT77748.1 DUF4491 family protein [bacterium J10(2018)]HRF68991.1 DUF4491 family protein [Muribaculum sp.]
MSTLTQLLEESHTLGLVIGLSTFIIIGLFHPVVIKCEYHFGVRCWWWFLVLGTICLALSIMLYDVLWSSILGVAGFSSYWTIKEIFEQQERVRKGWFPRNPRRTYPWDNPEQK